jgi:hypothetical protein
MGRIQANKVWSAFHFKTPKNSCPYHVDAFPHIKTVSYKVVGMIIFHRTKFQVYRYSGHHIKNIPLGRLVIKPTPEDTKPPVE